MIGISVSLVIASATIRDAETNGMFSMRDREIEQIIFNESTRSASDASRTPKAGRSPYPYRSMKTPLSDSLVETLLREGLPPPNTRRWVVRRMAAVVIAVQTGVITVEQACQVYQLTEEEFLSWKHAFEAYGFAGLSTTRIQQYRRVRSRRVRH